MGFERLRFFNFRNLKDRELSLGAREVFLVGQNGQGKTNLLEAVHLLSVGSSFREKRDAALARDPSGPVGLSAGFSTQTARPRGPSACSSRQGAGRSCASTTSALADRRGLLSEVLCLCFVQQDMEFVVGSPEDRRRFFDQTLVLSDLSFLDSLRSYRQVLKSRNLCLRENRDDLLDVYDAQLAAMGLFLQDRRAELVREFDALFGALLAEISGARNRRSGSATGLPGKGCPRPTRSWRHLALRRERDRLIGDRPHRDPTATLCSYVREREGVLRISPPPGSFVCARLRSALPRPGTSRSGRPASPCFSSTTCCWSWTREGRAPFSPGFRRTSRRSSPSSPTRAGGHTGRPTPWCSRWRPGTSTGSRSSAMKKVGDLLREYLQRKGVAGRKPVRAAVHPVARRSRGRPWRLTPASSMCATACSLSKWITPDGCRCSVSDRMRSWRLPGTPLRGRRSEGIRVRGWAARIRPTIDRDGHPIYIHTQ